MDACTIPCTTSAAEGAPDFRTPAIATLGRA